VHAQQDEFRIQSHTGADSELKAAYLAFNAALEAPDLERNHLRLRAGACRGLRGTRGAFQRIDGGGNADRRIVARPRINTHARAHRESRWFRSVAIEYKQLIPSVIASYHHRIACGRNHVTGQLAIVGLSCLSRCGRSKKQAGSQRRPEDRSAK
jgi:hypothetical protein